MASSRLQQPIGMEQDSNSTTTTPPYVEHGEQLLQSGIFSDCQITCKGRSWNLHRAVLVPRCDFFRACFTLGFRESSPLTGENGGGVSTATSSSAPAVVMDDDEPEVLDRLLRYLYTYTYPAMTPRVVPAQSIESTSETHSERVETIPSQFWTSELSLLLTADKYSVSSLQCLAASSIIDAAKSWISDTSSQDHCDTFRAQIDDFTEMLYILFHDPAVPMLENVLGFDLRKEVLDVTGDMVAKYIATEERLVELLGTSPTFGIMLIQTLACPDDGVEARNMNNETPTAQSARESPKHKLSSVSRPSYHEHRGSMSSDSGSGVSNGSESSGSRVSETRRTKIARRRGGNVQAKEEKGSKKVHIPMSEESDLD